MLQIRGNIQLSALYSNRRQVKKYKGESSHRLGHFLSCRFFAMVIPCTSIVGWQALGHFLITALIFV